MLTIKSLKSIATVSYAYKEQGLSIGFVPTMGALHKGHLSLIATSKNENDITICSIFINPTQFNNADDLKKYPVTTDTDIDMLEAAGCDVLFLPSVQEMYAEAEQPKRYELGDLENVLEGKYRPGHFQGVCIIVDKLLAALLPHNLYMGNKDYQQCMVVKKMLALESYKVNLQICPTIRENGGLAMSSRNMRLTSHQKEQSLAISQSLLHIKQSIQPGNLENIKGEAIVYLEKHGFKVDYSEIADAGTLALASDWDGKQPLVALVAAYIGEVRLIDNILIND